MPNPLLIVLARGINPGLLGASAGAAFEDEKHHRPTTKKGAIIGGIIGGACLLILLIWGVCSAVRKTKKAQGGVKTTEVGGTSEENRPLATEGYPMAMGGQGHAEPPMISQIGSSYQPYAGAQGGYPLGPQGQPLGQQGTNFYRNQ